MSSQFSRRAFLAGFPTVIAGGAWANAPTRSLRPRLRGADIPKRSVPGPQSLLQSSRLTGKVAFAVVDSSSGKLLESHNGTTTTPPASVAKAVTALYALNTLGAGHRFRTSVVATGAITNGVVMGDLVLVGGGDPTLDTDGVATLAAQVKAAGIKEVRGNFLVWDRALPRERHIDGGQPDHVGYNPAVSGIALNFNRVHFEWRRGSSGYNVTMQARTVKYRPQVSMAQMKVVARDAPVYSYTSKPKRDEWSVARGALGRDGARWLPVRLPALYAGDVFRTLARSHGIVLPAAERATTLPKGTALAQIQSAPLSEILQAMLRYSNNLIAEMVGMSASRKRNPQVRSLRASGTEMSRWAARDLGMGRTKMVDHSGLGEASRMSAEDMCAALVRAKARGFRTLLRPFTLRDTNGRSNKAHPIKVDAKTGTLNFVSSLAGYATAQDGTEFAFAILSADLKTRSGIPKAQRERPPGARTWNTRAKLLQSRLIERWASLYSG